MHLMFIRTVHVVASINSVFFVIAEKYSIE